MFVVITDVISNDVPPPVIAVCFLILAVPEVMFCDEVACAGVQAASEEAGCDEVDERC